MKICRGLTFILLLFLAWSFLAEVKCMAAQSGPTRKADNEVPIGMTPEELQSAVMNFADSLMSIVGQASIILERKLPSAEARLEASRLKVYTFSSAVDIASSPSSGVALLDMVVMVTLSRIIWEEHWQHEVFGKPAAVMVKAFKTSEEGIWSIAAKVLTSEQQKELKDLILEWRKHNPDQTAVGYIRFSDFGALGKKPGLSEMKQSGGLLAPIEEAAHAADEIRLTAERAKYMLSRMQAITNFQVELMFKELILQPEPKQLLFDITKFRETAEHFTKIIELLPEQIAKEREDAITQFMKDFSAERNATILQAAAELSKERKAMFEDIAKLIEKERSALFKGIEKERSALFKGIAERQANVKEDGANIVSEFNTVSEKRVDHIFWRLTHLIIILSICALIIVIIHHLLSKRFSSERS